jgi:hypothetical protein
MRIDDRRDVIREMPVLKQQTVAAMLTILSNDPTLRSDVFRTCISCFNWEHETETCGYYKQRPPATIIANGCDTYTDIPF